MNAILFNIVMFGALYIFSAFAVLATMAIVSAMYSTNNSKACSPVEARRRRSQLNSWKAMSWGVK